MSFTTAQTLAIFKGVRGANRPEDIIFRQALYIRYLLENTFEDGAFTFPDGVTFTNVGPETLQKAG